jgi:LytS/YehU family sensor histidine kinase
MSITSSIFIGNSYLFPLLSLALIVLSGYLIFRLILISNQKKKLESRYAGIEEKMNSIQLTSINSKLDTHLVKNILNSIQSHAYQTYFAIDKLSHVLDYILYDSHKKYVTPKEEIEFALSLIEINKIKLSPLFELKVKVKIHENEPLYNQYLLAPLISIDLIENAFKHADLQSPDAFISVTFSFVDSLFSLTVANKISAKSPMVKDKGGIGNDTLDQRLRIIYGSDYKFEKFVENNTYIAHLKINLLGHKAKMLAAG